MTWQLEWLNSSKLRVRLRYHGHGTHRLFRTRVLAQPKPGTEQVLELVVRCWRGETRAPSLSAGAHRGCISTISKHAWLPYLHKLSSTQCVSLAATRAPAFLMLMYTRIFVFTLLPRIIIRRWHRTKSFPKQLTCSSIEDGGSPPATSST